MSEGSTPSARRDRDSIAACSVHDDSPALAFLANDVEAAVAAWGCDGPALWASHDVPARGCDERVRDCDERVRDCGAPERDCDEREPGAPSDVELEAEGRKHEARTDGECRLFPRLRSARASPTIIARLRRELQTKRGIEYENRREVDSHL